MDEISYSYEDRVQNLDSDRSTSRKSFVPSLMQRKEIEIIDKNRNVRNRRMNLHSTTINAGIAD